MSEFSKNPFPGIRSFEFQDAEFFFGREKQIAEIIENLKLNKFTAVLGPSGSGKSSIIKAGVIPHLIKSSKEKVWEYLIFSPGNNPLSSFSKAFFSLISKYKPELSEDEFEKHISTDTSYLFKIISEISADNKKQFLIYIDQLEDIFFYADKSEKNILNSTLFIKYIIDIVENKDNNFYILTSLKADYLGFCRNFEGLVEIINKGHYLVPQLNKDQKVETIVNPIKNNGFVIADELLSKIITETDVQENQLLILQHTLKRIWDYHLNNFNDKNIIEFEHYSIVGGVENALNNHADEIYQNLETEKNKILAEKIFKSLILIKSDLSISRTSVLLVDICNITGAKQNDIVKILDEFRNNEVAFIEPSINEELNEDSSIRISRDIVIDKWTRLKNWIADEKNSVQIYRRISVAAGLYQKGEAKLFVNPELQQSIDWLKTNNPNIYWAKRYDPYFERAVNFIEYSKSEFENQMDINEKKQKSEVKRLRNFTIILGVASVISILFLLFALNLRYEAQGSEKQAKENERLALDKSIIAEQNQKQAISSKKVAEQQQLIAEQQKLLAEEQKLFAVEKQREAIIQKALAEEAKEDAVVAQRKAEILKQQAEELMNQAIIQKNVADEQRVRAESSESKTDSLRKLSIAKSLAVTSVKLEQLLDQKDEKITSSKEEEELPKIMAIQSYKFNLKSGGEKNDPEIFNALSLTSENVKIFKTEKNHIDAVRDIAVFSDGNSFVTCSDDGTVKTWDVDKYDDVDYSPLVLNTEISGTESLRCLDISSNQKNIACGTIKGKILFWSSIEGGSKAVVFPKHTDIINDIKFVSENIIISVSNDKTLLKTNVQNLSSETVKTFENKPLSISISKDKTTFAVADNSGKITFFSGNDFTEIKSIQTTQTDLSTIEYLGNNLIAAGTFSGTLEIINISTGKTILTPFYAHISGITRIVYNEKLSSLGTCSYDGMIKIWDINNFEKDPIIINEITGWIYAINFSSDGENLFAGSADKTKPVMFMSINTETLYNNLDNKYNENMSEYNWLKYIGPGIDYSPEL